MKYIQTKPLKRNKLIKIIVISSLPIIIFLVIFITYKQLYKKINKKTTITQKNEIKINDKIDIIIEKDNDNNEATNLNQGEYKKDEVIIDGKEYLKYTYIIQKDDTLWKISKKFLNDAYAWSDIQKYNENIKDPHWIEINDKIIIYIPRNR